MYIFCIVYVAFILCDTLRSSLVSRALCICLLCLRYHSFVLSVHSVFVFCLGYSVQVFCLRNSVLPICVLGTLLLCLLSWVLFFHMSWVSALVYSLYFCLLSWVLWVHFFCLLCSAFAPSVFDTLTSFPLFSKIYIRRDCPWYSALVFFVFDTLHS
jgi:uncharacterized membrane protein